MRFASLPSFAPSLSLSYTMWLIVYGIFGAALLHSFRMGGRQGNWGKAVFLDGGLLLCSYFLSLAWQPFFYSAHFLIVSFLTLLLAAAAMCAFLVRIVFRSLWLSVGGVLILGVQVFFIVLTAGCF